jgi:hypothetical protein
MRIASSDVLLSSQHAAVATSEVRESLRMWIGQQRPDFEGQARGRSQPAPPGRAQADAVHFSQAALAAQPSKQIAPEDAELSPEDEPKLALLIRMIEVLTGKKIKLISPKQLSKEMQAAQAQTQETTAALQKAQQQQQPASGQAAPPPPERAGYGVEYDYYERHYEAEKTTFAAEGVVQTQDGKTIQFSVDLSMSREFQREQSVSLRAGDAQIQVKDPLVLNFNGNAAELTTTRYSFDIDSDGRQDQIAFVSPNSGFLALDRNKDGVINNGSELFGAATGQGFAELAAYDEDGNQWIDENDSIYQNLRIWSKDAGGRDQLVGLGERGVGAIYLGHVTTPFALKDSANNLQGQIRDSGVFLSENGAPGTVQQIDLSV